jgi:hypothetical protein
MSESKSSGGIGLTGMTFIVFLVLKLCNVITWSWWWVTAPLWGSLLAVVAIIALVWIGAGIITIIRGL